MLGLIAVLVGAWLAVARPLNPVGPLAVLCGIPAAGLAYDPWIACADVCLWLVILYLQLRRAAQ